MANVTLAFTAIKPKKMNINQYRKAVERALELEGRTIEALYKGVSNSFSSPVQYKTTKFRGRSPDGGGDNLAIGIRVATSDIRMVSLDEGTNTRWAVMSKDFQPKTVPGRLSSRAGAGKAVVRGRRAMTARNIRPRPGIKPRKFSEEIVNVRENEFPQRVQRAIDLAAEKTY